MGKDSLSYLDHNEIPVRPGPDPTLTRASISFHTNDDDKNDDTRVDVFLWVDERRTLVARLSGFFGQVDDHSDIGPFTMVMLRPVGRNKLKNGHVEIVLLRPVSGSDGLIPDDTWRFSFFLDLFFADGGHLFAKANDVVLRLLSPHSRTFAMTPGASISSWICFSKTARISWRGPTTSS
jgi:hypothetical protein